MPLIDGAAASFLLVDDNEPFLELLEAFVLRHYPKARVARATTGEQALDRLSAGPFDVVLLDYRLPDFDGLEVLGEIRSRLTDVAVVMVTGEGDERLAADIFRMGAYDYLVKSAIDPEMLRRCLDQVLTRRLLEEQITAKSDQLVASSRELNDRTRALDVAYAKIRTKKEQLRHLSDGLEQTVQERTAKLRATTSFLNQVLDSSTDHFIVATDGAGLILTFSRGAELAFGRPSEEVVGQVHFRVLFDELEDDEGALGALTAECLQVGSVRRELTGIAHDGRAFAAQLTVSRLPGEEGQEGLVILGADVTHERELEEKNQAYVSQIEMANQDLRRKNEQILEATRLKSEFLANVSHELRTPLNAIIGYGDLLAGGIYGPMSDKQTSAVEGVATRGRDLLALINDILDLAKIEAGKMELRPERFDLDELVEEVVETGRILAIDKRVEISGLHHGDPVVLVTDRQKMQQIVLNLINNAVKFTPDGFVRVETREVGSMVEVAVIDSGIGIPGDELANLFDEFRQVDGTSTREYGGTGLGLAISQKFAMQLGGQLTVTSTLGEGSRFVLALPLSLPGADAWSDPVETDSVPVALDTSGFADDDWSD
jgi:PAS domain S-box-containing protein